MKLIFFDIFVPYIHIIRINNWIKNLLVFLPVLSSHNFSSYSILYTLFIFIMLSVSVSSMYIINDYFDYEKDLLNNSKKKRPIASGKISKKNALIFFLFLQLFIIIILAFSNNLKLLLFLLAYNFVVLIYTLKIKTFKFLDVTTLAFLFLYRVFLGAELNNLEISIWILNFTFFLFLGLGFLKRYSELNSKFVEEKNLLKLRPYNKNEKKLISLLSIINISIATILLTIYLSTDKIDILYEKKEYLYIIPPLFFVYCMMLYDRIITNQFIEDPISYCVKLKSSWIFMMIILSLFYLAM